MSFEGIGGKHSIHLVVWIHLHQQTSSCFKGPITAVGTVALPLVTAVTTATLPLATATPTPPMLFFVQLMNEVEALISISYIFIKHKATSKHLKRLSECPWVGRCIHPNTPG